VVTQNIDNNAAILVERLVRHPKKLLFIRDKGVYQLGIASEEQRVPAEYQQYLL